MKLISTVVFLVLFNFSFAQVPFADEIRRFKQQDSIQAPPQGAILFVGSSSFRMWKDIKQDFPKHQILNRGFGGSTFEDVLRFSEAIIIPYKPKQVVIYCGENDLAKGVLSDVVLSHFKELYSTIRASLPDTHIVFVSIKPSPSRINILDEVRKTNQRIKNFLSSEKEAVYVDVFSSMLTRDGLPREELFLDDRLHMNRKGYDIWKKSLLPYLK